MKHKNDDNSNSQTYRERYARILRLEEIPAEAEQQKRARHWYFLLTVLLGGGLLGVWFFFKSPTLNIAPSAPLSPSPTGLLQAQPGAEPPAPGGKTEVDQQKAHISKPVAALDHAEKTATPGKPQGDDVASVPPPFSDAFSLNTPEIGPEPAPADRSLIVLLSTASKQGAIERAKELSLSGVPVEVILSTSGYYGVVLRRDSYQEAVAWMNALIASGVAKDKPYIMPLSRLKVHIYP